MSRNFYDLYESHLENIYKLRGVNSSGMIDRVAVNKVESRATFLTLLDALLFEHRKKYATPFNDLSGRRGLEHLVQMKHHWTPQVIRESSFSDLVFSIQEELTFDHASDKTKQFLTYRHWDSLIHHYDDFPEDEWDPNLGARYLKWHPQSEN